MRIIAGAFKGRTLQAPRWDGLRPTSDRLRETLFNVLAPWMPGARVLDGFAGTGAVGIEAISRGASHVTFVERDPRAVALIEANLQRCGVKDRYAIIRAGFSDAAARVGSPDFDIIFLDPPYGATPLAQALEAAEPMMSMTNMMGAGTLLVVEHARRDESPAVLGRASRTRLLPSGDSALSFYRRAAEEPVDDRTSS